MGGKMTPINWETYKVLTDEQRAIAMASIKSHEQALETLGKKSPAYEHFHTELKVIMAKVNQYDRMVKEAPPVYIPLCKVSERLVHYRIFYRISQEQVAKFIESSVDEQNRREYENYDGATVEEVSKVLQAIGLSAKLSVSIIG